MTSHAVPATNRNFKAVVLHCGTNDIRSKSTPGEIASEITELPTGIRNDENTIDASSIIQRDNDWNEKVAQTNSYLVEMCEDENLIFVNNDNISPNIHLNRRKLHLNHEGTRVLAKNLLHHLG